jgi:hypothetical protein
VAQAGGSQIKVSLGYIGRPYPLTMGETTLVRNKEMLQIAAGGFPSTEDRSVNCRGRATSTIAKQPQTVL